MCDEARLPTLIQDGQAEQRPPPIPKKIGEQGKFKSVIAHGQPKAGSVLFYSRRADRTKATGAMEKEQPVQPTMEPRSMATLLWGKE